MGVHKSALKRERQTHIKRSRNQSVLSNLKTLIKRVHTALEEKQLEKAQKCLREITSALDKSTSKGYMHRNTSKRKVSRLTLKVNSLSKGSRSELPLSPSKKKKKA